MVIGHKKNINFLEKQFENDSLAHSYIFCGPESVGKKTVAIHLAEKILGRKIKEVDSDVFFLYPENKKVSVDDVREFIHKMSLGGRGNTMIFVIDKAEKLNKSSQNALLKSIEEPKKNRVLILITSDEKKILPTVFSRCQKIRFGLVGEKDMKKIYSANKEKEKMLRFWSQGRPGVAVRLIEDCKEEDKLKEIYNNFKILFQGNIKEKMSLAKSISQDKDNLFFQMEMWCIFLRSSLLKINDNIKISSKRSFFLLEKTLKTIEILKNTQVNARLVLEDLFLNF